MGKDSLLKATSKKPAGKTGPEKKKKTRPKSSAINAKAASKRPKQAADTRKAARKPAAAKKVSGVKAKASPRGTAKKATPAAKKVRLPQKLALKQFDRWRPKSPYQADAKKEQSQIPAAPPFVSTKDKNETERIRGLLFKQFDSSEPADQSQKPGQKKDSVRTDIEAEPNTASTVAPPDIVKTDPVFRTTIYLVAGIVVLLAMVIAASISNRANFYLTSVNGAVEVWQGTFAPLGKERIIILPGSQTPAKLKAVYTKNEAFSFVFSHYLEKADMLLDGTGMPDFEGIKLYLDMARSYAVNETHHAAAASRINTIDLMTYLYKADVAASKGTGKDYQEALVFLKKAAALKLDNSQMELVKKKIQSVEDLKAKIDKAPPASPQQPAEKPPAITPPRAKP